MVEFSDWIAVLDDGHSSGEVRHPGCEPCARLDSDACVVCGVLGFPLSERDKCANCDVDRFFMQVSRDTVLHVQRGKILQELSLNAESGQSLLPYVFRNPQYKMTIGGPANVAMFSDPAGNFYLSPSFEKLKKMGGEVEGWKYENGRYVAQAVPSYTAEVRSESSPEPLRVDNSFTFTCASCLSTLTTTNSAPPKLCRSCSASWDRSFAKGGVVRADPPHRPRSEPVKSHFTPAKKLYPAWDPEGRFPELHQTYLPEVKTWRDQRISDVLPLVLAVLGTVLFVVGMLGWSFYDGAFPWLNFWIVTAQWVGVGVLANRRRKAAHELIAARCDAAVAAEEAHYGS